MTAKAKSETSPPALLGRDAILGADDRSFVDVPVPEWGGTVRVGAMSGTDRDAWELLVFGSGDRNKAVENVRASLLAFTIVDADGKRVFSAEDVKALGAKSSAALDRVFTAAKRLNRLSDDDVEDLAKN